MHIFKNENMERVWNVALLLGARLSRVRAIKQSWSHVEAILEPSWSHLEAILKPSWSQLRPAWGILEHSLIYLELWRQRVTAILDNLGATLGHLGAILEGIIFKILKIGVSSRRNAHSQKWENTPCLNTFVWPRWNAHFLGGQFTRFPKMCVSSRRNAHFQNILKTKKTRSVWTFAFRLDETRIF